MLKTPFDSFRIDADLHGALWAVPSREAPDLVAARRQVARRRAMGRLLGPGTQRHCEGTGALVASESFWPIGPIDDGAAALIMTNGATERAGQLPPFELVIQTARPGPRTALGFQQVLAAIDPSRGIGEMDRVAFRRRDRRAGGGHPLALRRAQARA